MSPGPIRGQRRISEAARGPLEHTVCLEVTGKCVGKKRVFSWGDAVLSPTRRRHFQRLSAHRQASGSPPCTQGSGRIPPRKDVKKPASSDSLEVSRVLTKTSYAYCFRAAPPLCSPTSPGGSPPFVGAHCLESTCQLGTTSQL